MHKTHHQSFIQIILSPSGPNQELPKNKNSLFLCAGYCFRETRDLRVFYKKGNLSPLLLLTTICRAHHGLGTGPNAICSLGCQAMKTRYSFFSGDSPLNLNFQCPNGFRNALNYPFFQDLIIIYSYFNISLLQNFKCFLQLIFQNKLSSLTLYRIHPNCPHLISNIYIRRTQINLRN